MQLWFKVCALYVINSIAYCQLNHTFCTCKTIVYVEHLSYTPCQWTADISSAWECELLLCFLQLMKEFPLLSMFNIHENLLESLLELQNYADVQAVLAKYDGMSTADLSHTRTQNLPLSFLCCCKRCCTIEPDWILGSSSDMVQSLITTNSCSKLSN